MSLTAIGGIAKRSFELVWQSLVQGDGLPFVDALTAEQMQQAFDDKGISFGEDDREPNVSSANTEDDDGIVSTPAVILWASKNRTPAPWSRCAASHKTPGRFEML